MHAWNRVVNPTLNFYSKIATWLYGDMEHAHEFVLCHVAHGKNDITASCALYTEPFYGFVYYKITVKALFL